MSSLSRAELAAMTRTAVVKLARLLCAQGYGVRVRRHAPARRPAYYTVARL